MLSFIATYNGENNKFRKNYSIQYYACTVYFSMISQFREAYK